MATDLNAILKKYLAAMGKNESNVAELTKNLRSWVKENGEVVKEKVESQIDETASRMGFVKAEDLEGLLSRIADLESRITKEVKKTRKKSPKKNGEK